LVLFCVGSFLFCVSGTAWSWSAEYEEWLQEHRRVVVVSWIVASASIVMSMTWALLFPNWKMWTGIPMKTSYNPYVILIAGMMPSFLIYFSMLSDRIASVRQAKEQDKWR
jgi:hypothetical protein